MKTFNKIVWTMFVALTGFLVFSGIVEALNGAETNDYMYTGVYQGQPPLNINSVMIQTEPINNDADTPSPTFDFTEPNTIWTTREAPVDVWNYDKPTNIIFGLWDKEVEFVWKDGLFDVVYDPNDCTGAAEIFFECMLPYLNAHIEAKAKELAVTEADTPYLTITEPNQVFDITFADSNSLISWNIYEPPVYKCPKHGKVTGVINIYDGLNSKSQVTCTQCFLDVFPPLEMAVTE